MRVFVRFAAAAASAAALATPGSAMAVGQRAPDGSAALSPHWIKISTDAGFGGASAGLLRTSDGRLHVLWPADDNGDHSLHYSTVSARGRLLAQGVILTHWNAIDQYPSLVRDGGGMRAIFDGANGKSGARITSAASTRRRPARPARPGSSRLGRCRMTTLRSPTTRRRLRQAGSLSGHGPR